jgi:hypothetical protein
MGQHEWHLLAFGTAFGGIYILKPSKKKNQFFL